MSTDPVRQANLAAIACEPRPHLPDGFRRASTRPGAQLGATRTGLSVAGPDGAHFVRNDTEATARVAMFSSTSPAGAVVYPDTDMVWMWTADDAVDLIVERSSAVDAIAPWTGKP